MDTIPELIEYFQNEGGTRYPFRQSEFLRDNPMVTTIRYNKDKTETRVTHDVQEGICHALSLRFIEGRLMNFTPSYIMEIIEAALPIVAVQQMMINSGTKSGRETAGVKGKSIKGKGLLGSYRPFNSRKELVQYLLNNPGLYEYGMYGDDDGHSVAFDIRQGFWFFDANSGLWHKRKRFASAQKAYDFIYYYWELIGYKRDFELDRRDMHKYA